MTRVVLDALLVAATPSLAGRAADGPAIGERVRFARAPPASPRRSDHRLPGAPGRRVLEEVHHRDGGHAARALRPALLAFPRGTLPVGIALHGLVGFIRRPGARGGP